MSVRHAMWPAAFAIALAIAGCAAPPESASSTAVQPSEAARLSTAEVVRIASDVARARGIDLAKYSAPVANYKPGTWVVLFEGNEQPKRLGYHFGVVIDDMTGKASFHGGR